MGPKLVDVPGPSPLAHLDTMHPWLARRRRLAVASVVLGLMAAAGAVLVTVALMAIMADLNVVAVLPTLVLTFVGALGAATAVRERQRLDHLGVIAAPGASRQKVRARRVGRSISLTLRGASSDAWSARFEGPMRLRRTIDTEGRDVEVFGIIEDGELVILRVGDGFLYAKQPLKAVRPGGE